MSKLSSRGCLLCSTLREFTALHYAMLRYTTACTYTLRTERRSAGAEARLEFGGRGFHGACGLVLRVPAHRSTWRDEKHGANDENPV